MKKIFVFGFLLPFLIYGCKPGEEPLTVCKVEKTDYIDKIRLNGMVQAVNTVNILAPMVYFTMEIDWVIPEGTWVKKGDTVCKMKCKELDQFLDMQIKTRQGVETELKMKEAQYALSQAMLESDLRQNETGKLLAKMDSVRIGFASPLQQKIMKLELEKARIMETKIKKKQAAQKIIAETEIRQLKSRIIQANIVVTTMEEQYKALVVLSPGDGMVSKPINPLHMLMMADGSAVPVMAYPKPGNQVRPRKAILSIPDLNEVQIVAEAAEVDFMRLDKGQTATFRIDAADGLVTTGVFKRKSLRSGNSEYAPTPVKTYEIIFSVDSCHRQMTPGFSAVCDVLIGSVKDTVVVPTLAIFEKDSLKVVYISDNDLFIPASITTGLSNSSHTIVTSGLKGGETISLVEPPLTRLKKQ